MSGDDDDFPFAGHSLDWIKHFAGVMRELATEAPTDEMRTAYAEIARGTSQSLIPFIARPLTALPKTSAAFQRAVPCVLPNSRDR